MYAKLDSNLRVLLRIAAVVGLVILCVPWSPWMPSTGLDPSWVFVLHHAFAEGWQWGKDITFTFGPLGFTYGGMYHPETYSIMLLGQLLFVTSVAYAVFVHARHIPTVLQLVAIPGICIAFSHIQDLMLFSVPLILVFFSSGRSRTERSISIIFSILCAYVSLVKFTAFLLAIPLIIISDFCYYRAYKKIPYYSFVFIVSTLILYLLAGQEIQNFGSYIEGSFLVASGYSSSMQIIGPHYEIALFLLVGGIFVGWYGWALWSSDRILTALRILAVAIFGFMIFKASFTRHDGHAMLAFTGMFLGIFMLSGWYFSTVNAGSRKAFAYSSVYFCFFYTYLGLASHFSAPTVIDHVRQLADITIVKFAANAQNMVKAGSVEQGDALSAQYASALASIKASNPLPNVKGTVDVFPYEQAAVLANGLNLQSRPIFQSYSVYTDSLIDRNIEFLEGDTAAAHILFQTGTIDGRFVNLDEGGTWPTIAKWYGFDSISNGFAVLKRLQESRPVELVTISKAHVSLNEIMPVPVHNKNLWISLKFQKNLLGALAKALIKLPIINMSLNYTNGDLGIHRIVPEVTDRGFLLNPLIRTGEEFALMLSGGNVGGPMIKDLEIKASPWAQWLFAGDVDVEFSELRIGELEGERLRVASDPVLAQLVTFNSLIAGAEPRGGALPEVATDGGMVELYAHAPSRMNITPPEAKQLLVKFGIRDKAWQRGTTDGVCFKISSQDRFGAQGMIWERCLTPLNDEADRGEQTANINLPSLPQGGKLVFETDINGEGAWDWS